MRKNEKSATNNKVVKQKSFHISLKHLAEMYGVSKKNLVFAIAETSDGEDGWDLTPVVLIKGTDNYIDLLLGQLLQNTSSRGLAQKFHSVAVMYNRSNDSFNFNASSLTLEITMETLYQNFGREVVVQTKI